MIDKINQSGATMIEYIIALTILAVVFIAISPVLRQAGEDRANISMDSAKGMVPCGSGSGLSGDQCK